MASQDSSEKTQKLKNYFDLPAPAKINLFLHVVGRTDNGYHLLQSVFQLVSLFDYIDLEELPDGKIERAGDINWSVESDLCWKAAKLLQEKCPDKGVRITVRKNIPDGAGLGGGSSDAATVLIGLNQMWGLGLTRQDLCGLGVKLGADVPFFIFGQTAFAEGIGEVLQPVETEEMQFQIIFPGVRVSTAEIFNHPDLTRNTNLCTIANLRQQLHNFVQSPWGRNDLETVARSLYAPIEQAVKLLTPFGNPRMSGSGSAVYVAEKNLDKKSIKIPLPENWRQWAVKGLKKHPLWSWTC